MIDKIKHLILEGIATFGDIALTALFNNSELEKLISGDKNYELADNGNRRNIVLITEINDNFILAIKDLLKNNLITFEPVSFWVINADGGRIIDLPIAQKMTSYKKPHWLPVIIKKGERFPKYKMTEDGIEFSY